jgi:L-fuculose-phosphate aldolase
MHLSIYLKRPDVGAVIHFHSVHATALASLHETIPPFLEELIPFLGENVPTVEYAMAGTEELALNVANVLLQRNAVLLANHGAVVCGKNLQDAFHKALLLEKASTIYLLAKATGLPKNLPESAIEVGRELFRTMML